MSKTVTVPLEALENPVVSLQTKIVYCLICSELKRDDKKGLIYDDLAVKCGLSRKQLTSSIKELVNYKLLTDHPSLNGNSIRRDIQLGTVTDWSKITEKPVKLKVPVKPKALDKVEK